MSRRLQGRVIRGAAIALALLALLVATRGLVRHNTWYLASDQYAFLTFAADLQRGTVFHDPEALEIAAPQANQHFMLDARVQTYFWRDGKLYSRYPPGFPALLALAGLVGGELAQHWLNPVLYLTVMAVLGWLTWALLRSYDSALAAGTAVAAMWLILLLPTDIHLWGITVARDLPAHLLALLALLAASRGRLASAGFALGLACTIRPDAVLYGAPLAALFWLQGPRVRPLAACALAFLVGASPLFAYNTITQGHPLAFTQGGEFRAVLGALLSPSLAHAGLEISHVSGGAFRLANLPQTLPGNLRHVAGSLGWLLAGTALGAVFALRARRRLAAALLPYPALALPFYSCWGHPDPRYLAGVILCLLPVTALGVVLACRWIADERRGVVARVLVLLASALVLLRHRLPWPMPGAGGIATTAIAAALAVSALATLVPRLAAWLRRPLALAPAVALATAALAVVFSSAGSTEPFQREQIMRARETLGTLIPPGSLVITSEALGRPAENISHYIGAHAFYRGELPLLFVRQEAVVSRYLIEGRRAFFLLRSDDRQTLDTDRPMDPTRVVARARGAQLYDWFIDPAGAPFGAVLYEVEPSERTRRLRELVAKHKKPGKRR